MRSVCWVGPEHSIVGRARWRAVHGTEEAGLSGDAAGRRSESEGAAGICLLKGLIVLAWCRGLLDVGLLAGAERGLALSPGSLTWLDARCAHRASISVATLPTESCGLTKAMDAEQAACAERRSSCSSLAA